MSVKVLIKGIPIILEHDKKAKMNTVVIGSKIGSRYESDKENGMSHFLEHMAFKSTVTRKYDEIAKEIEGFGGIANACTGQEYTLYYISALSEYTLKTIEILSDILTNALYLQDEINKERNVIFQEIKRYTDDPESVAYDALYDKVFKGNPLGKKILGTEKILSTFTTQSFKDFITKNYNKHTIAISIYGNFDKKEILTSLKQYIEKLPKGKKIKFKPVEETSHTVSYIEREFEQNTILLSYVTSGYLNNRERWIKKLISTILGNGMSSRLFLNVRETKGLTYGIYSTLLEHEDISLFVISSATENKHIVALHNGIKEEIENFNKVKLSDEEFKKAKNLLKSTLVLNSTKITNIASNNLICYFRYGEVFSHEALIELIDSITKDEIARISKKIFSTKPSCVVVGKNVEKLNLIL